MGSENPQKRGFEKGQKRPYWYHAVMWFNLVLFALYTTPRGINNIGKYIETRHYDRQCKNHDDCYFLKGSLTQTHLNEIKARQDTLKRLYINSSGGQIGLAADISKIIYHQNLSLHIVNKCSSACSNYFIPAAKKVYALNTPILASHGSILEIAWRFEQAGYNYRELCNFSNLRWLDFLLNEKGLSQDFTLTEIKHLGEVKFLIEERKSGCPRFTGYQHEVSFWLPTRTQYRDLLGIDIEGKICADDLPKCAKKIAPRNYAHKKKNLTCVIEDTTVPCRFNRRGLLPWEK